MLLKQISFPGGKLKSIFVKSGEDIHDIINSLLPCPVVCDDEVVQIYQEVFSLGEYSF